MYQKGDLLWIPAGTLMNRPRIPGKDDLFSNFYQTTAPSVAIFLKFKGDNQCLVMMGGDNWTVPTKNIKHNVQEVACAN
jgi:hypothetical protein